MNNSLLYHQGLFGSFSMAAALLDSIPWFGLVGGSRCRHRLWPLATALGTPDFPDNSTTFHPQARRVLVPSGGTFLCWGCSWKASRADPLSDSSTFQTLGRERPSLSNNSFGDRSCAIGQRERVSLFHGPAFSVLDKRALSLCRLGTCIFPLCAYPMRCDPLILLFGQSHKLYGDFLDFFFRQPFPSALPKPQK